MYYYLRYMGCVTWTVALVALIVLIKKTAKVCKEHARTSIKVWYTLILIADALLGSALGILFYQVAALVKK